MKQVLSLRVGFTPSLVGFLAEVAEVQVIVAIIIAIIVVLPKLLLLALILAILCAPRRRSPTALHDAFQLRQVLLEHTRCAGGE